MFMRITPIESETMIEESVYVMNAIATVTKHIKIWATESRKTFLYSDGAGVSLDMLLITTCPLITHIKKDKRLVLANYTTEIEWETSNARAAIPLWSQIVLKSVNSGYIS